MDYIKAIKTRESVRSYQSKKIEKQKMEQLKQLLQQSYTGPFQHKVRFELINFNENSGTIGTYGIINNAQAFIAGITKNTDQNMIDFGYAFEGLILDLTLLGLGTCWLGGTFKRNDFEDKITLDDGEIIPCISPIGYSKNKKRLLDRLMRTFAGSDDRKQWSELFFHQTFDKVVDKKQCQTLQQPLEMLRRSPSASNKQPWRILLSNDYKKIHFFIKRDKKYKKTFDYDIQLIDIGIAMYHFEKTCEQLKLSGAWSKQQLSEDNYNFEYVITYIID